ncbi:MAG: 23S rRNA (uracil(1939)-C(5))-methyltransferase RlmD [Firmicutes bacterium]|nr:23S rRNA (uracil(1939)-C(5))-methyltransferase RlmD [Bacillota bacterium]
MKVTTENNIIIEKNKRYKVEIETLGTNGEGIGRIDGFTVFIEGALPGETIDALMLKVNKNYGYAKIVEIEKISDNRSEPRCKYYKKCGGCNLQHIKYEYQLEFKKDKVKYNLERIGGFDGINVNDTIGAKDNIHYRNKAQFPVGGTSEKSLIGFFRPRSHNIEDIDECIIQHPKTKEIVEKMREYMRETKVMPYDENSHTGIIRHILTRIGYKTGEIMVCIIINGNKLPKSDVLVDKLLEVGNVTSISFNVNKEKTNVIMGDKICMLYGKPYITDKLGELSFEISPLSFFQVNPVQTEILYNTALGFADISDSDIVIDAYCGIGTISLFLAQKAKKVYGIEIVEDAIKDAKRNAEINSIDNAEFIVGKSEEVIPMMYKENGIKADVVVVDPPRKGCDAALIDVICDMSPERIVYVSCDSATLARDLKQFCCEKYKIEKVTPVDQFCQTSHIETAVLLSRK